MNRKYYFDYISDKLLELAYKIKAKARLNLLELNIHSETFFEDLLNIIYAYQLENINKHKVNSETIDLKDSVNKIAVQVSSEKNKQKIEKTLSNLSDMYSGYNLKFIIISPKVDNLQNNNYVTPDFISFNPKNDILDLQSILKEVLHTDIDKQKEIFDFIKKELGDEQEPVKMNTNLAAIIDILSKEDLAYSSSSYNLNSFNISKKIKYNQLKASASAIQEYKVYYSIINGKYKEYASVRPNTSLSVLSHIQSQYVLISSSENNPDMIFIKIIENVIITVQNSKNYKEIAFEELEMCVSMLVVDAFIKCKIFENPEGYKYVASR